MAGFNDLIYGVLPQQIVIPPGGTYLLVSESKRLSIAFKLLSGGTLYVTGTTGLPAGITLGYLVSTNERVSIGGPAQFYLAALGATCTVHMLKGYSGGI